MLPDVQPGSIYSCNFIIRSFPGLSLNFINTCFCTLYSAKIQFEYFYLKDYTVICQGGAEYDNRIRLY
ncbi:hypothetical protein CLOSTHATH_00626 [Hungatella hathewayi DSM 13479]|uniref:Uncharacterized protein n=1 Tax=Hungatella hathewayi DSM 13479 TaxID=566550 RepID=D3AAK5_9FIRM|nr:hypothetical protein CLOSTHATH_00626 [Hungatella hathewayi DSM 13479]